MDFLNQFLDVFFHLDKHLGNFVEQYGALTYAVLFMIIFIETGLVFMPFLPGDSLLFAAGMMAAKYPDSLNIWLVIALLLIAAILGDSSNYLIGRRFGIKIQQLQILGKKIIKPEQLAQTHGFYQKYGASTIVIARFVPVVRTLAPFVGGLAAMNLATFLRFNVLGAILWVIGLCLAGYYLGSIPLVRDNFEKVILGIIALSVLPILWQLLRAKFTVASKPNTIATAPLKHRSES